MTTDNDTPIVWHKSSYSGDNGGNCVEVAALPGIVPVRDSKDPAGAVLAFSHPAWRAFVAAVRSNHFPLS